MKILTCTMACFSLFSTLLYSQIYSFNNYGAENNIPDGFIYTINQSDDGFLWVGTGSGLARFDGYLFDRVQYPDSSLQRIARSSLCDKNGTLWYGCDDGTVFYTKNNKLIKAKLINEKAISELMEGPDGFIWVVTQGKALYSINPVRPDEIRKYTFSADPVILSALFINNRKLLVGTQENLLVCSLDKDSVQVNDIVPGLDYTGITSVARTSDSAVFLIGTGGSGLYKLRVSGNENELTRLKGHPELESLNIQSVIGDREGHFWISTTGSGAIQLDLSGDFEDLNSVKYYNLASGLITDNVKTVFEDKEGNFWFGSSGNGISMLSSYAFGYYVPGKNSVQNNIIYINSFKDGYLLGTPSGFHIFDPVAGKSVAYTVLTGLTGNTEITSYLLDSENNLWIGTGGNGLYLRSPSGSVRRVYRSGDSGADFIKDIEEEGQTVWLATTNGVIVLDRPTGVVKHKFDINNGLPHNSINKIIFDRQGKAYIGTESDRLYSIDKNFNIAQARGIMSGNTINKIISFTLDEDGAIWAATSSNGVFRFSDDSVMSVNRSDDLMSNYCYSILADSENDVWIGHELGFSRFNTRKGTMRVYGTDYVKAGVCNPGAIYESGDKKIFIGTTDGLVIYDMNKERKSEIPPFTNINYIMINDVKYSYRPSFVLPYSKKYVIRVNYVGISFSNPGKVYYSTYLENYDNDWSRLSTAREMPYILSDGKYKFSLVSVNEDGLSQESATTFSILVKKPFWRTWWFILIAAGAIYGTVILFFRQREKTQKKVQDYLEKELDLRTRVVLKQKAEIELQNIEITDSINYAKRIQSSILPDVNKLKEHFRDAFILFQPRDIVSGDYYWFDRIDDERIIVVCADSTGHGVPGAFMSMIGSTLLQDIVTRKMISKPSEILSMLDRQIFSTLNQNIELGVSNDGMDMVVCEFNTKTRHLRFASAMRPVIIVMDGETYYIKGNRSSIGGESVNEKFFDDQEYYLKENDKIYLFSDGLSDQFGGPDGKKMKIARLKRLIEQISELQMGDQKDAISSFYTEWKGTYDQVDDILLMGVKV